MKPTTSFARSDTRDTVNHRAVYGDAATAVIIWGSGITEQFMAATGVVAVILEGDLGAILSTHYTSGSRERLRPHARGGPEPLYWFPCVLIVLAAIVG